MVTEGTSQELVLVRGLPGSGKTTYVRNYYPNYTHFEADLYRYDGRGEYLFEPSLCHLCHLLCLKSTEYALLRGENVIVANTFVTHKEIQPYRELADKYNVELKIVVCDGNYENIHGVPEDTIENMKRKWQD